MDIKTKWFYNKDLSMWFHTSGATSKNPEDKIPDPITFINQDQNPKMEKLKDCGCGKKGNRQSR